MLDLFQCGAKFRNRIVSATPPALRAYALMPHLQSPSFQGSAVQCAHKQRRCAMLSHFSRVAPQVLQSSNSRPQYKAPSPGLLGTTAPEAVTLIPCKVQESATVLLNRHLDKNHIGECVFIIWRLPGPVSDPLKQNL